MQIVQFNAENVKRLKAVEIRPNGSVVEITGRNGQGKTSILDAIWWALDGNKNVQSKPVRDGEEKGWVRLDLGEYIVTKTFKQREGGDTAITLTVQNKDGAKYGSPHELLQGFIGNLTFDPLAFSRMKPREQVVALRALVPDYDFDAAEKQNKDDFAARTEVNRVVRDLNARIAAFEIPDETPEQHIDSAALFEQLNEAMAHNTDVQGRVNERERLDEKIASTRQQIASRRATIEDLQRRIRDEEALIDGHEAEIKSLSDRLSSLTVGDMKPIEQISAAITDAERLNKLVDRRIERDRLIKEREAAEAKSKWLTKVMDDRKEAASEAVRKAQLPVPGLELTEEAILLNGQPFEQASDAEQLRVSIAVAGAMNPKLRVIRVRDGSLLDPESMQALADYATANDLQVWVETVASGRESAVVIEDGMVASVAAEEAA